MSRLIQRGQAVVCALAIPLCALVIHPGVEYGIIDDWAYLRMAQVLARTGHFVYNGWPTAMIGWLVFAGAAMAKLFGASFTAIRATIMLLAMATGFLMQRTLVRAGLLESNASLATLMLLLSPLFLPLAFTFMTDVPGVFGIVVCLYCGIRALQAAVPERTIAWLALACLVSVVGGTGRQTVWLGALAMVPGISVALRNRRRVLPAGAALTVVSLLAIVGLLHWFELQPYSVHEPARAFPNAHDMVNFARNIACSALELPVLLLPLLVAFVPALVRLDRRAINRVAGVLAVGVVFGLVQHLRHRMHLWVFPWLNDWVSIHGAANGLPIAGERPVLLGNGVRLALTALTVVATVSFAAVCLARSQPEALRPPERHGLNWRQVGWLLGPLTACYLALLIPRGLYEEIYDRYLLPLMLLALVVVVRLFQERVQPRLPAISVVMLALFAFYGIAATHDMFAMYRGRAQAVEKLRAAGVPAEQIDGGFEYDGLTEIDHTGYLADPRIHLPGGALPSFPDGDTRACAPFRAKLFPSVAPRFAVSLDPDTCAGPAGFAPVVVKEWLGPRTLSTYIVREPD